MTVHSPFNPKLFNQLKIITSIQKDLSKVKSDNIEEIGHLILNKKEIVESQAGVLVLSQCFNDMADFHPKNIELLADLFIFLQKSSSSTNYLHLLKDFIVISIHTREKLRSSFLFFLRTLLIRKSITIDSIINEISKMEPQKHRIEKRKNSINSNENENDIQLMNKNSKCQEKKTLIVDNENIYCKMLESTPSYSFLLSKIFNVLNWFYPEIKEENQQFIQKIISEYNYQIPQEFKEYDLENIKQMMNIGYSIDSLAKIIRDDDIESFLKIVSELGVNFNINQIIKSSKFERCSLLSYDPILIQYASFFNSIKIFKYLFLNKADIHIKNNGIHPLIHFAIAGGSFEIIHILEQKNLDFCSGIPISIKYFQNDIFSWIIENHPPQSEIEFSSINYYYTSDAKKWNYFLYRKNVINLDDGDAFENDFYHKIFYYYSQDSYGYRNISDDDDDENEEEITNDIIKNESNFQFFDFDFIFQTIMETNNYLALFLLFDHGMNINDRNKSSKKTLLHFAIQKGKTFLVKLLLSNKFIDFSLKEKSGQNPIVYSVKYMRENIFFLMIKDKTILDSLTTNDYIMMLNYADVCELQNIKNYLSSIWKVDLMMMMMETDDIKNFCNSLNYLSLSLFQDQIGIVLTESFKTRKYDYFCIFANRALKEKSLKLNGKFYFVPPKMKKDMAKEFRELCCLLAYYSFGFGNNIINYYLKYKRNLNGKTALTINPKYYSNDFKENEYFSMRSDDNVIIIYYLNDLKAIQHSEISLNNQNNDDTDKKKKKKSSNNKPMICVDDYIP